MHPPSSLQKVQENIYKTKQETGRSEENVTLIAVTKNFPALEVLPFLQAGHRVFGENRVQEAQKKWPSLRADFPDLVLHLIGPLQSNKVKEAVQIFDVIQTVDREKIAKALSEEMQKQNRFLPCYIQVNTGLEEQKSGIDPRDTKAFLEKCRAFYQLPICGLMCIPPKGENPGPHFALLRKLAQDCGLEHLSMGMSADYSLAIAFGATHIRVGSALFGQRPALDAEQRC